MRSLLVAFLITFFTAGCGKSSINNNIDTKGTGTDSLIVNYSDTKRNYIEQIISIFEHGTNEFNYGYAVFLTGHSNNNRGDFETRGATLGRIFVTGTTKNTFYNSDAMKVIDKTYELDKNNSKISTLYNLAYKDSNYSFMPTSNIANQGEVQADANRSQLDNIMIAWKDLADNVNFKKVQDEVFYENIHNPIRKKLTNRLNNYKIHPLTYLCIVDAYVLRGIKNDRDGTLGGDNLIDKTFDLYGSNTINNQEDELAWVSMFLEKRRTNGTASDLNNRKDRINILQELLNNKNFDLEDIENYPFGSSRVDPNYLNNNQ